MPGYQVKVETVNVAGHDYQIRSLLDLQQYHDPLGEAEKMGITPATWPLFGHLWPSSHVLALTMSSIELAGKRVLEVGAGLGLASLVVQRRKGNMTVSDCHPLSQLFLNENTRLNNLPLIRYETGNWATDDNPSLGQFDLIIGSDVLYERSHPEQLAGFIAAHSAPEVEVLVVDPMRQNRSGFRRAMLDLGYLAKEWQAAPNLEDGRTYKGRFLFFSRGQTEETARHSISAQYT